MALFPGKRSTDHQKSPLNVGLSWQLLSIPLIGLLALPLLALLFEISISDIFTNLKKPAVEEAIWISAKTSLFATLLSVLLGTPLAVLLSRKQFLFKRFLDSLVDLPIVLPPAVAGVALLLAFGRRGLLGEPFSAMGIEIPFTQMAVVLAQMFVAAPLYVRSAVIGFSSIDNDLEDAATIDGANTWQVLRFITFPVARTALVGGAVLTWARAIGEFGATIIFAGNLAGKTQTMPLAIFIGFELDFEVAITLSVLLMGTSFLILLFIKYFLSR